MARKNGTERVEQSLSILNIQLQLKQGQTRIVKILVLNWEDRKNPFAGGAEVHLHEVFSRIAAAGHEVTLLTSSFTGAEPREELDGMDVHRYGHFNFFNYEAPFYYRKHLAKREFDIVIDDINKVPFCTPLFIRQPILSFVHHLFGTSVYHEVAWPFATYVYLWEKVIPLLYRRVPFIVGSLATKTELIAQGINAENVKVVNYGLNAEDFFHNGDTPKNPTPLLIHFGRLKKYKSVDVIIRAIDIVKGEIPNIQLKIIGTGDDQPRLEQLVDELGLRNWIEFTGFLEKPDVVKLMHQAWLTLNASIKEGWGLTVVESNACGTPVVAANSPGLSESVVDGKTGWLVPYGDVHALANQIIKILKNPADLAQKTANTTDWAKRFSWDRAAEQTLQIIETIVEEA